MSTDDNSEQLKVLRFVMDNYEKAQDMAIKLNLKPVELVEVLGAAFAYTVNKLAVPNTPTEKVAADIFSLVFSSLLHARGECGCQSDESGEGHVLH